MLICIQYDIICLANFWGPKKHAAVVCHEFSKEKHTRWGNVGNKQRVTIAPAHERGISCPSDVIKSRVD